MGKILTVALEKIQAVSTTPVLDLYLILELVTGLNKAELLIQDASAIEQLIAKDSNILHLFQQTIARRAKHEPMAYILGKREFWEMDFIVTPDVLIPRPDSEVIIQALLKHFPGPDIALSILDLGTGSGCLLLSAIKEYPNSSGVGVDNSVPALKVAEYNCRRLLPLQKEVQFVLSNWFTALSEQKFNVIIANPPYISPAELCNLSPEVREFEPHAALTDHNDGLQNYRVILKDAWKFLAPQGILLLEIGIGQADAVRQLAQHKYHLLETFYDIAGHPRCLSFAKFLV